MTSLTPITDDWINTEIRNSEVEHQTENQRQIQKEARLQKVDIYVRILYDIVWVGMVIFLWMALTQFVPFLKLLWDILAILGCSVGILRILYKLYLTLIS